MPTTTTKPWLSRTVWLNTILAVLGAVAVFAPQVSSITSWIAAHGADIALYWGILGVLLRLVTKNAISLGE